MGQTAENTAFASEPFLAALPDQRQVEELHRNSALESPIGALRQPDAAHAALTNLRHEPVDAHRLAAEPDAIRQTEGTLLQESAFGQGAVLSQQRFQPLYQAWIFSAKRGEPLGTFRIR